MDNPGLVLASASPRRRELLERMGLSFEIVPSDMEEVRRSGEEPAQFVRRMAREKAHASDVPDPRYILAADTIVVLDDDVLGKPADRDQARSMLQALSDRTHRVITGTCVLAPDRSEVAVRAECTEVVFRRLHADELDWYLSTGEWSDKAGAYAVQGAAASFVRAVRGSYTNVVGLPLAEVVEDLRSAGAIGR